ncbi:MAG: hypothetical protein JO303_03340, partial [Caulobacteraceae bacterium]|nr:hypothetical protein [Caulobacteraceae bacterium]
TINARLDPPAIERKAEDAFVGGCVLFFSNTEDGRRNIEDRRKFVAATVHWALDSHEQNIAPLPKLCISFDVFGNEIIRAPTSFQRLRKTMTDACREAAAKWPGVEPPQGYDGPDWR